MQILPRTRGLTDGVAGKANKSFREGLAQAVLVSFSWKNIKDLGAVWKWFNWNAPGSYTPWCHSLLGSILEYPFPCIQEKEMLHLTSKKVQINL